MCERLYTALYYAALCESMYTGENRRRLPNVEQAAHTARHAEKNLIFIYIDHRNEKLYYLQQMYRANMTFRRAPCVL